MSQATEHRDSFNSYAHLWTDNKQEFLTQFLIYGHIPTQVSYNLWEELTGLDQLEYHVITESAAEIIWICKLYQIILFL